VSGAGPRVRVDKWLWAVRVYKTRTAANEACSSGRVRVNDEPAKPATKVGVGDEVRARVHGDTRVLEVVALHEKRVGAPIAAESYIDRSPPPAPRDPSTATGVLDLPDPGRRDRGTGRPTKRDRRDIDRLRRGAPPNG
jgi:ribosome-associated heat shock protein Hsp15